MKRILSNIMDAIRTMIGYSIPAAILWGYVYVAFFWLSGWPGLGARIFLVVFFLMYSAWDLARKLDKWDAVKKTIFLFATQFGFFGLFLFTIWMRAAGEYQSAWVPFLRNIRFMTPDYLSAFLNPFDITQQYFGIENIILSLLTTGGLIIASLVAVTININVKKLEDAHVKYSETSYEGARTEKWSETTTYRHTRRDGSTYHTKETVNKSRFIPAGWRTYVVDINNPMDKVWKLTLIPVLGFLFLPLLTFTIIMLVHTWRILGRCILRNICVAAIVAVFVALNAACLIAERQDDPIPRAFTPSLQQVRMSADDWNEQAPDLLQNYTMRVKRPNTLRSSEVRQVIEDGRIIRYYRIRDNRYLAYGDEYWSVTENGETVIYMKNGDTKTLYKPGSEEYDRVYKTLNRIMLDTITEKWLPFYTDETFTVVTDHRANESKLVLSTDPEEFTAQGLIYRMEVPARFYMTNNKITIYDFHQHGQWFRVRVTYGNAKITLPADLNEYTEAK